LGQATLHEGQYTCPDGFGESGPRLDHRHQTGIDLGGGQSGDFGPGADCAALCAAGVGNWPISRDLCRGFKSPILHSRSLQGGAARRSTPQTPGFFMRGPGRLLFPATSRAGKKDPETSMTKSYIGLAPSRMACPRAVSLMASISISLQWSRGVHGHNEPGAAGNIPPPVARSSRRSAPVWREYLPYLTATRARSMVSGYLVDLVNDRPEPFWEYWELCFAPRQWFPTPRSAPQDIVRPSDGNGCRRNHASNCEHGRTGPLSPPNTAQTGRGCHVNAALGPCRGRRPGLAQDRRHSCTNSGLANVGVGQGISVCRRSAQRHVSICQTAHLTACQDFLWLLARWFCRC
jgi:hypothetical protein